MDLPGYDAWKTTPPEFYEVDLSCNCCGYVCDDDGWDGDDCPECDEGTLLPNTPVEPCTCSGDCYC